MQIAVFVLLAAQIAMPSAALAWKPRTHLYTAQEAVAEILDGANSVTIDGRTYEVDPRIAKAIRDYPDHYFGGAIGPDGFPDIVFGQAIIHPDSRCKNGAIEPDDDCDSGSGASFSDEWMQYVYQQAWDYYIQCSAPDAPLDKCADPPGAVLAFSYGFLVHAAGDLWGHTYINDYARGVFPDILGDPTEQGIAVRHIVVESYVDAHTPGDPPYISAPPHFIYDTFIESNYARELGEGSHFDQFLSLKKNLDGFDCGSVADIVTLWICDDYVEAWSDDIHQGLRAWPQMSIDIARALYYHENTDAALEIADDFLNEHLLSMLGAPDFVGDARGFSHKLADMVKAALPVQALLDALNPLDDLRDWLIEKATGLNVDEWKNYLKNPESYVNCSHSPIELEPTTSQRVDKEMGVTTAQNYPCGEPPSTAGGGEKYDPSQFAAVYNTIVLARLLLLGPKEVDQLLNDYHVGAIYDRPGFPDNAVLGFIRTLDGNHQWRDRAPTSAAGGSKRYSSRGGMPLWRDCLARERVFRELFNDWQNGSENFPKLSGECDKISEPLPPVEFILTPKQESLPEWICFGTRFTAKLINHKHPDEPPQPFALYVRVTDSFGKVVFHRVIHGILDGFETQEFHFSAPQGACGGTYALTGYLFERMWSLGVDDRLANPLIQPTDLLLAPVNSPQTRTFLIITDPQLCSIRCYRCDMGFIPPGTNPGGPVCTERVEQDCDIGCDDLLTTWRSLDADQDGIPDGGFLPGPPGDNCPTVPNQDQRDIDGNGVGDVCEKRERTNPFDRDRIAPLLENLSNAKYAEILGRLFGEPGVPKGPGPWCLLGLTCPEVFDQLSPAVREFTKAFDEGLVSPETYAATMRDVVRGPSIRTDTTEVLRVSLVGSSNAMVFAIKSPSDDKMTIRLPRALLDAKISDQVVDLVVLVNGSVRPSSEMLSATYRMLEIPLRAGDSEIWISGTQLGPAVGERASTCSTETMLALTSIGALIALLSGFLVIRYRRHRRSSLAVTPAVQGAEKTSSE